MPKKLIINAVEPREIRASIINTEGDPERFFIERSEKKFQKGNVYWARVTSVEQHLQAAFVELERGQHGFLGLSDIMYPDGGEYLITGKKSKKYLAFESEEKEKTAKKALEKKEKELDKEKKKQEKEEQKQKQKQEQEEEVIEEIIRPVLPKVVLAPNAGDMLLGGFGDDLEDGEQSLSPIIELEIPKEENIPEEAIKETSSEEGGVSESPVVDDENNPVVEQIEPTELSEKTTVDAKTEITTDATDDPVLDEEEDDSEATFSEDIDDEERGESDVDTHVLTDDGKPVMYSTSNKRQRHTKKIEEVLHVGQYLAVQIVKEGIGKKAPMVTTYLSFAGHYLVMMPGNAKGGVSKQIRSQQERVRLRKFVESAEIPDQCALILRTAAEKIEEKDLSADLKAVTDTWANIQKIAQTARHSTVLKREEGLLTRVIRDYYNKDIDEVWVDEENAFEDLKEFFKAGMEDQISKLHFFKENKSIFAHHKLDIPLQALFKRKVMIPGGGSLVFDQCEAMLVIDINSGTFKEGTDDDDTAFKLNMLACKEIARQVQMRDVGGIVMIDFVDMRRISQRTKVERELEKSFKGDKAKLNFMHIGVLGVMEMSRQRTKDSLRNSLSSTCSACDGTGLVPSKKYSIMGILREIRENAGRFKNETLRVFVTQEIALELLNKYRSDIDIIENEFSVTMEVLVKDDLKVGEFSLPQKNKKIKKTGNKPVMGDNSQEQGRKKVQKKPKPHIDKKKENKPPVGKNAHLEKLEKENPDGGPLGILPASQRKENEKKKKEEALRQSESKVIEKSEDKQELEKTPNMSMPENEIDKKLEKKSSDVASGGENFKSLLIESLIVDKDQDETSQPKKVLAKRNAPRKKDRSKKKVMAEPSEELANKPQKAECLLNEEKTHDNPK